MNDQLEELMNLIFESRSADLQGKEFGEKGLKAFHKIKRQLSEEELGNTGVQRLLLNNMDRLEEQVDELKTYAEKFHKSDKENGILKEKLEAKQKTERAVEILSNSTIVGGSLLIPYSLSKEIWLLVIAGALFVLGGIVTRYVKR